MPGRIAQTLLCVLALLFAAPPAYAQGTITDGAVAWDLNSFGASPTADFTQRRIRKACAHWRGIARAHRPINVRPRPFWNLVLSRRRDERGRRIADDESRQSTAKCRSSTGRPLLPTKQSPLVHMKRQPPVESFSRATVWVHFARSEDEKPLQVITSPYLAAPAPAVHPVAVIG